MEYTEPTVVVIPPTAPYTYGAMYDFEGLPIQPFGPRDPGSMQEHLARIDAEEETRRKAQAEAAAERRAANDGFQRLGELWDEAGEVAWPEVNESRHSIDAAYLGAPSEDDLTIPPAEGPADPVAISEPRQHTLTVQTVLDAAYAIVDARQSNLMLDRLLPDVSRGSGDPISYEGDQG